MDESSSRALGDLRALVASCTPVQVFSALAYLWKEAAAHADAPVEDAELWEFAAEAAHEAAVTLTFEDEDASPDEESAGAASSSAEGVTVVEGEEAIAEDDDEAESMSVPTEPAPAPSVSELETTTATHTTDEDTTMARDTRLGLIPERATFWRLKRVGGPKRKGEPLFWDDRGVAVEEWSLRALSARTILDRWGPGDYVIQYIAEENGRRRPCGNSRVLHLTGQPDGQVHVAESAPATSAAPAVMPPSAPSYVASVMPMPASAGVPPMPGGDPMFANVFALMTYMNDQNERARAQAAAEARIAADRYRAELDAQLERERIASQERIAIAQSQGQLQAKAVRAAGPFDPDALAEKIGAVVGAKLQEARDEELEEEDETPAPPIVVQAPAAPADNTAKIIDMISTQVVPILAALATNLAEQKKASRGQVIDHAAE